MSSIVVTGRIPARPVPARASRSDAPAVASARLRLTRRGRIVVRLVLATLLLLAIVAVGVLATSGVAAAGRQARPVPTVTHVVLQGETLWQIARSVDPAADPRDVVARIVELNGLRGVDVQAGARLVLPVEG